MEKITTVIPTKSRASTLLYAVQTALAQHCDNYEVIVSDNFSQDDTADVIAAIDDSRLKYYRTPRPVSMAENFEFGISKAQPGWIVVIGDDDGLIPNQLAAAVELVERTQSLGMSSDTVFFRWPDARREDRCSFSIPLSKRYRVRKGSDGLKDVMTGASVFNSLPLFYTGGIVHSTLIERLRSMNGRIFNADAPDVYSAVAHGRICERYVRSRRPFAISGISKASNGGTRWDLTSFTPTGAAAEYLSECRMPVHPAVPTVRNGQIPHFTPAMVYDSYLQSQPLGNDLSLVTVEQQLAVFNAHRRAKIPFVREWINEFRRVNDIDCAGRRGAHGAYDWQAAIKGFRENVANATSRYRMPERNNGFIRTVYDAGVVSAFLLESNASASRTYLQTIRRLTRLG